MTATTPPPSTTTETSAPGGQPVRNPDLPIPPIELGVTRCGICGAPVRTLRRTQVAIMLGPDGKTAPVHHQCVARLLAEKAGIFFFELPPRRRPGSVSPSAPTAGAPP